MTPFVSGGPVRPIPISGPTGMIWPRRKALMGTLALVLTFIQSAPAHAQQDPDGDDGPGKPVTEITIAARRLDAARANIEPDLGASSYALSNDTVESRPGGETTRISQILLQAPGVAQDGSGQLRLRQSKGALQYRINNVILPEGLTDLGESLSPRIAAKVQLVTGALPAQYGLVAGGIVNITTKDGVYLNGGQAELYGGSQAEFEPAFEYGGSIGQTNYFASGSYLRNNAGIASRDGSASPAHDETRQVDGFAFLNHVLDAQTRISLILGASDERFAFPNVRGIRAADVSFALMPFQRPLSVNGTSDFASEDVDGRRRDVNRYGVLSLLHATDKVTLQLSGFVRYSRSTVDAAGIGDILFTGVGRSTNERTMTVGGQAEGVFEIADAHTLRGGLVVISDITKGTSRTLALPIDGQGRQTSDTVKSFVDHARLATRKDSIFLQDEWRPIDRVTINFGARVDHVKSTGTLTRLGPRLNFVWTLQDETMIHGGYARYIVPAPTAETSEKPAELAATSARTLSLAGQPVRAESDDYYDLGAQHNVGNVTIGIDGYWRLARHLIDDGQFGTAYETINFNYARGRIRGIELSSTYNGGRLSGWANVAIAEAGAHGGMESNQYYFSAAQLAYAAGHALPISGEQAFTASGGLSYRLNTIRLSADMLYGSGFRRTLAGGIPNGDRLPGYIQVNLSAVYRIAAIRDFPLDARFDLINAFDRKYQLRDGTALGDGQPQWGARRGVFVGIEQSF